MIDARETITFDVQGTTGAYLPRSVDSVRQVVIDNLTPFFDVQDVTMQTDAFTSDPFHYISNWPYKAVVRVVTRDSYADVRDVDSIVAHAFYEGAGELPTVTARGLEAGQGDPDKKVGGFSIQTLLILAVVVIVAFAVIEVAR